MNTRNWDWVVIFSGVFLIMICIIIVVFGFFFNILNPQNGEHTGYITAVENSGFIFKTNKLFFKTDSQSSQEDLYCIPDSELFKRAKELSREKKQVTIIYKNGFIVRRSVCGGKAIAIITEIN